MLKTVLKYGVAAALGAAATTLLSDDTRRQISKAADGVVNDVKAKATKAGEVVAKVWREEVIGEKSTDPEDESPAANA